MFIKNQILIILLLLSSINVYADALEDINDIDIEIDSRTQDIERIEKQFKTTEKNIKELEAKVLLNKSNLDRKKSDIRKSIIAVHGLRKAGSLIFLTTTRWLGLLKNLYLWKKITNNEIGNINNYQTENNKLNEQLNILYEKNQTQHLLLNQLDNYRKILSQSRQEREELIRSLTPLQIKISYEKAILSIKNIIKQYNMDNTKTNEKLIYPVKEQYQFSLYPYNQNAIKIAAKKDTPILAAGNGRIVYQDWIPGYGKTTIVCHAKSFCSIYGHLDSWAKDNNSLVQQGEEIGKSGSTGSLWGEELFFAIYKNGKIIQPFLWLNR